MSADTGTGGVVITAKDMYDQLVVLSGKVDAMASIVKTAVDGEVDHENRIRSLERWRYSQPASLAAALGALLTTLLTRR